MVIQNSFFLSFSIYFFLFLVILYYSLLCPFSLLFPCIFDFVRFIFDSPLPESRDNVDIVTGLQTGRPRNRGSISAGQTPPYRFCNPINQHAIQSVTLVLSPAVKRPEREAKSSLASSAEVKNDWSYNSITPYAFVK
jgi:hypothetical protein